MTISDAQTQAKADAQQRFDKASWNLYSALSLGFNYHQEHMMAEVWDITPLLAELQEAGDEVVLVSHGKQ